MEDQIRQESKAKKVIKIVIKLLYQILIIFCALLTAVIILQKISDSNRSIGGYRIFRVITGSMEPEYQVHIRTSKGYNLRVLRVKQHNRIRK